MLGVIIFLAIVAVVCGVMLAPNSPYVKQKCRANSIKGHSLSFTFYPPHSDVRHFSIVGFLINAVKQCKVMNGFKQVRVCSITRVNRCLVWESGVRQTRLSCFQFLHLVELSQNKSQFFFSSLYSVIRPPIILEIVTTLLHVY